MNQIYGHEFLGAAKYEKFAINNLPYGRSGKTFSKEFGPSQTVLRKWAEKGDHPVIATQGLWRGGAHDYSGSITLKEGLNELAKLASIAEDFPFQNFQFSIFCEHKLKTKDLKKVFLEQWSIVESIENIVLVNNPMAGGDLLKPGAFGIPNHRLENEIHGTWNPKTAGFAPYSWACDGLPAQDCNIEKYKQLHNEATVIWLWMQQYNCKAKVDDTTPIPQRKVKPVAKQVISLEYLIPDKGDVRFDKNSIFKTHADQHGNVPKGREQKPVIITPVDADKLKFVNIKGRRVGEAPRAGNYTDGRPMYRSPEWGFETQERANKSGSSIVEVIAVKGRKETKLGTVNPAFRENAWRAKAAKVVFSNIRVYENGDLVGIDLNEESTKDFELTVNLDWV